MTDVWSVLGLSFLTLIMTLFLRQFKPEYALAVSAAGCVVIIFISLNGISSIKDELNGIFNTTFINDGMLRTVFKSIGICYITSFASSLCKDFGQAALSAKVEIAGRIAVVILTLPLVREITDTALELIG